MEKEFILKQFGISQESVVAIYPYGSRVYGCHTDVSDHDWVIVHRSSMLPSGAFRDNAISSEDRYHQAICYSRSGFRNAIDSYEIGALECAFLPQEMKLFESMAFPIRKWDIKELVSAIISKASNSWHTAVRSSDEKAKKNIFHALRILEFGTQMAEHGKIVDYSSCNGLRETLFKNERFKAKSYISRRDELMDKLRAHGRAH